MHAALLVLTLLPLPLTDRLGARDWRTRERAASALRTLGPLACGALEQGLAHKDPEVRSRCAVLLRPYAQQIAEREASQLPCPPFWECFWLWSDDPRFVRYWHSDYDRHAQTRAWTVSQLLQRRPRAEILRELERMTRAAKAERP